MKADAPTSKVPSVFNFEVIVLLTIDALARPCNNNFNCAIWSNLGPESSLSSLLTYSPGQVHCCLRKCANLTMSMRRYGSKGQDLQLSALNFIF